MRCSNLNSMLNGIADLSAQLNSELSPVDWYNTLKKYEQKNADYIKKQIIPETFCSPVGVQVEITYNCNLKCIHCYNSSGVEYPWRKEPELRDEEWLALADELVQLNIFECIISGGEPLLRKELLYKFMDKLSAANIYFILISNGWLIDDEVVSRLGNYLFQYIQISIDGATPEVHDNIRMRKGSWDRAVNAAMLVKNANLPLCVASTVMRNNMHQIADLIDLAAEIGASEIIIDRFINTGSAANYNADLELPDGWRQKYFEILEQKRAQYYNQMLVASSLDPAIQLRQQMLSPNKVALVRPNGDVKLDCILPFVFGNVRRKGLCEIWQESLCKPRNKKEMINYIESIKSNADLLNNKQLIPHATQDINLEYCVEQDG